MGRAWKGRKKERKGRKKERKERKKERNKEREKRRANSISLIHTSINTKQQTPEQQ